MAFETGYAANEFQLQEKLKTFLTQNGWNIRSQINNFDTVLFSAGEDGYQDIYVRLRCAVEDRPSGRYGRQRIFKDGYSGYMNFFTYQYFPEDGDGYDGYGEAGRYGPRFLWWGGDEDLYYAHAGDVSEWQEKNGPDATVGLGSTGSESRIAFDGISSIWFEGSATFGSLGEYYLGSEKNIKLSPVFNRTIYNVTANTDQMVYWVDPNTRKEYIWIMSGIDSTPTKEGLESMSLGRWNMESGFMEYGFAGPVWPNVGGDLYQYNASLLWNGHDYLYTQRGQASNGGSNTNDWARYHIPSDTWTLMSPDLPSTVPNVDEFVMMWLDKSISGFDEHRIYMVDGADNDIKYIEIDGDSGAAIGSWVDVGSTPVSPSNWAMLTHNNNNRFYYSRMEGTRAVYYADMVSGTLTWNLMDSNWLPTAAGTFDGHPEFIYVDGYASRVRTSLFDRTQYWFFADKDHVKVATKSDGQDSFCYAGKLFEYSNIAPKAVSTQAVTAGSGKVIPIDLKTGEFVVGEKYYIVNVVDEGGANIAGADEGISRRFKPGETITVTSYVPEVSITVSTLKNSYPVGSRIGKDPQAVGVTLEGTDKIQMLNYINNDATDLSGSYDMSKSMYNLRSIDEDLIDDSGGDARRNYYMLWPMSAVTDDTELMGVGKDVRGRLIGVFAISASGAIKSGDTITVGENVFLVIEPPTQKEYIYAIGPLEE